MKLNAGPIDPIKDLRMRHKRFSYPRLADAVNDIRLLIAAYDALTEEVMKMKTEMAGKQSR